jgi:nitrile hydratase alpha subunit
MSEHAHPHGGADHGDHVHGAGSEGHDHPHAAIDDDSAYRPESVVLEQALRELLIEQGVFTAADIQRQIELTESRTPVLGAQIIARAWSDAAFRSALLHEAKPALGAAFGLDLANTPELTVLENTPQLHHVVCCTLCSCYPRNILGIPPAWYKSREYRSRVVIEPRAVLREFGTELPPEREIRVVDSTADMRYLVIPQRPAGTDGWDEAQLAGLVTRDSMIGVAQALAPVPQGSARL